MAKMRRNEGVHCDIVFTVQSESISVELHVLRSKKEEKYVLFEESPELSLDAVHVCMA